MLFRSAAKSLKMDAISLKSLQGAVSQDTPAASQDTEAVNVALEGTDQMTFNIKEIKAKAGQTINVTLKHVGNMPKDKMGHNFVLLKKGVDVAAFGMEAMKAGLDKDYIPNDGADVIAHTKLLGGGETDTISFKAPEPGTYEYICSYPGHYYEIGRASCRERV